MNIPQHEKGFSIVNCILVAYDQDEWWIIMLGILTIWILLVIGTLFLFFYLWFV